MKYTKTENNSEELSKKAFKQIKDLKIPPLPEYYELWYLYFTQENPELNRAVQMLEEKKKPIDAKACEKLYLDFISDEQRNEKVQKAGDRIQETIKDVSGAVTSVKTAADKYNIRLEGMSGQLKSNPSEVDIEDVLANILQDTEDMMNQNQELEKELVKSSQAMVEMQRDLEIVKKEAVTDGLTGLGNRKAFDQHITNIIEESIAEDQIFTLIMMDIDHFKEFNDNYGHQVGDQVLRLVAKTLVDGVKGRDVACRYGGEEFALILPNTDIKAGMKVADQLRLAVANKEVVNRSSGEKLGQITLSAGVAEFFKQENLDGLIERADNALYTAKHNGRNQVAQAPAPAVTKAS